jgi:hypothetical protein
MHSDRPTNVARVFSVVRHIFFVLRVLGLFFLRKGEDEMPLPGYDCQIARVRTYLLLLTYKVESRAKRMQQEKK